MTGLLDVAGAFMPTPLPQGPNEVIYVIRPPSILVKLGLAEEAERWVLTRGMYGLRQSPKLWSEFRDCTIQQFREGKQWMLKQGDAEPNLWALLEVGAPAAEPRLLVLIYVDDILLVTRLALLNARRPSRNCHFVNGAVCFDCHHGHSSGGFMGVRMAPVLIGVVGGVGDVASSRPCTCDSSSNWTVFRSLLIRLAGSGSLPAKYNTGSTVYLTVPTSEAEYEPSYRSGHA